MSVQTKLTTPRLLGRLFLVLCTLPLLKSLQKGHVTARSPEFGERIFCTNTIPQAWPAGWFMSDYVNAM